MSFEGIVCVGFPYNAGRYLSVRNWKETNRKRSASLATIFKGMNGNVALCWKASEDAFSQTASLA